MLVYQRVYRNRRPIVFAEKLICKWWMFPRLFNYSHYHQFRESIETIGDTFIQIAASYGKASQQTSSQMMVSMMISSGICHIF